MADQQQISPQHRAALFAQATRQTWQPLPSISATEGDTKSFDLPKTRLTSRIRVQVEAKLNVKHASATSYVPSPFAPYTMLRSIELSVNNGFSPFKISGKQAFMYSVMREDASIVFPKTSGRGKNVQGLVASAAGADNKVRLTLDLPLTINDREPIGLVLTQNQETVVTVTMDIAKADQLGSDQAGYTFALSDVKITPFVESFSVPNIPQAIPDLSVLKLVQGATQAITGSGEQTYKFPTGMVYRKFAILIEDTNGKGMTDDEISANLEIIFNQADIPYRVSSKMLAAINEEMYGRTLPDGMYVFDLTYQGVANYGGTRDYINTENLTEFWLKFNTAKAGNITVVYENLTRMRTQG
ncbi:cytoplasmic protein [Paenibacillus sp. MER 99-2]|uniref:cytoplasmic protein n=1 Tax=Paenibacillus sp. MER 99-2 TaxID=2939572 RepID=UPI002040F314|nr:cytoplasmic protein [Paenibacillus sp. MER 99-2]MCM3176225.1 cytoplasmic protein [Paenibacillus sp. MER 99-2]